MSVRGTITERTGVSSSSKTLWIISRSSRSTTPSLAPTSTSVRSSSSDSSGCSPLPPPTILIVRVVNAPRTARAGRRTRASQPTGPRTTRRNCSGYFTAMVMGSTSPNVVRTRIMPMTSASSPKRWPKSPTATVAAMAEAPMLMTVMPISSVTSRSCGRSMRGATRPSPSVCTRFNRKRPREKYAASAPVRRPEHATRMTRTRTSRTRLSTLSVP